MSTTLLAVFSAGAVLALAYFRVGRPRTFVGLAFAAAILGSLLLFALPTPEGYDPRSDSDRPGGAVMTRVGERAGGVLFSIALASLLSAALFARRPSPPRA